MSDDKKIVCCEGNYCNGNIEPDTNNPLLPLIPSIGVTQLLTILSIGTCVLIALIVAVILLVQCRRRAIKCNQRGSDIELCGTHNITPITELTDAFSGSGSGARHLQERTIGRQVQKIQHIGKGRYGEVWLAKWHGDSIAVKQFYTPEEESWKRESKIYQMATMRHNNILGFIAADIRSENSATVMLLCTEYHAFGSLYQYLQSRQLKPPALHRLAASLIAGLAYLHSEFSPGKPAVAHRDIKSLNILVKDNGECVVADFGLAITSDESLDGVKIQVGTRRYMSPEVLDNKLNVTQFDEVKAADIYSVGLVLWEMARRCETVALNDGAMVCDAYAQPYDDHVTADPSIADMREVVCVKEIRPPIPERWSHDETLHGLANIMAECWRFKPAARLTALRIKKTLDKLRPQDEQSNGSMIKA